MSKKQALTEFHRGFILAAAERLFAARGTERTTMDDIAREAEYSKATLYVYFESKEEIIGAILHSGMVLLHKKIQEAIQNSGSWIEGYDAVCMAIVHFYEDNPTAYNAATGMLPLVESGGTPRIGANDILRVMKQINQEMADFLSRGVAEAGGQMSQPPLETALLIWSALAGMLHTANMRQEYIQSALGLDRDTFLQHGARLLLRSLVGIQPQKKENE